MDLTAARTRRVPRSPKPSKRQRTASTTAPPPRAAFLCALDFYIFCTYNNNHANRVRSWQRQSESCEARSFAGLANEIDWDAMMVQADEREAYDEDRWIGIAPKGTRLYTVIFTERGDALRIISLRRATNREIKRYESQGRE